MTRDIFLNKIKIIEFTLNNNLIYIHLKLIKVHFNYLFFFTTLHQ